MPSPVAMIASGIRIVDDASEDALHPVVSFSHGGRAIHACITQLDRIAAAIGAIDHKTQKFEYGI